MLEADFSQAALAAFKKRSRAISHRGVQLECVPVKEIVDGKESETSRVDVTLTHRVDAGRDVALRVYVWSDRWVWIDVRRASKAGWVWQWTGEGRFVSPDGARGLVMRVEETIDASWLPASQVPSSITAIWSPCLAVGPRSVG